MSHAFGIAYSPLRTVVTSEDSRTKLWRKELRDLARGLSGALVVALPLLYTLEMWAIARTIQPWVLLVFLLLAYFANAGYAAYAGYKPECSRQTPWFDALVAMGIGFVASLVTLLLVARYSFGSGVESILDIAILETIPTSFGAALAINQLGTRGESRKRRADSFPADARKILATVLGALLFSFNIAPTIEPKVIALETNWWHVVTLAVFSLAVSAMLVGFAEFIDRDASQGLLSGIWTETAVSYLIALAVSLFLLWVFGYVKPETPFPFMVKWSVVMGYVTSLGGSAGRVLL